MIKWFIICLVTIFMGVAFLIGAWVGVTIHVVDGAIGDYHKRNLLILYNIDLEEMKL